MQRCIIILQMPIICIATILPPLYSESISISVTMYNRKGLCGPSDNTRPTMPYICTLQRFSALVFIASISLKECFPKRRLEILSLCPHPYCGIAFTVHHFHATGYTTCSLGIYCDFSYLLYSFACLAPCSLVQDSLSIIIGNVMLQ